MYISGVIISVTARLFNETLCRKKKKREKEERKNWKFHGNRGKIAVIVFVPSCGIPISINSRFAHARFAHQRDKYLHLA